MVNTAGPLDEAGDGPPGSGGRNALYRNNGDGTFVDVAAAAGVDRRETGMGAAWGDYDNDGWRDLIVTAYGRNTLYHNEGDGTFRDRTETAGLAPYRGFWTGATWADYDRDGRLDLYVTGYVQYQRLGGGPSAMQYDVEVPASINPSAFPPERNLLFHNNGDGTFTERATSAGVLGQEGRSLAAAWSDFDDDGWPDLYVANDVSDNVFYANRQGRVFEDISHRARVADYRGAMGIGVGDWDGDGDQDLFITHWIAQENALFTNKRVELAARMGGDGPGLQFMDEADRYGLGQIALDYIGWGTSFFDYDNDGRLDLFVVNGSTFQQDDDPHLLIAMPDQLFWNRGAAEGFYDLSSVAGPYFRTAQVGRGAAFADYDRDGDVDVFVVNNGGPAVLLRNGGGTDHHWLAVQLEGRRSNRDAVGSRIRLVAGATIQVRQAGSQSSYLSQNSPIVHFGLGHLTAVDTLTIDWPSGARDVLTDLPADRHLLVVEGESRP